MPKRQAEELVARAAQDFDGFYAERLWSETANDTATFDTLLVMSCDGKGVAMRPEALRDATRKQAEQAQQDEPRGDPTEVRNKRRHTKRMATVTAVWDQEPCERSADDIVRKLAHDEIPCGVGDHVQPRAWIQVVRGGVAAVCPLNAARKDKGPLGPSRPEPSRQQIASYAKSTRRVV